MACSCSFVVSVRNCLASTLDYIVMQMTKTNLKQGYYKISEICWIKRSYEKGLFCWENLPLSNMLEHAFAHD